MASTQSGWLSKRGGQKKKKKQTENICCNYLLLTRSRCRVPRDLRNLYRSTLFKCVSPTPPPCHSTKTIDARLRRWAEYCLCFTTGPVCFRKKSGYGIWMSCEKFLHQKSFLKEVRECRRALGVCRA